MTLQNLAGIGKLKPHNATAAELARLLDSAQRLLAEVHAWIKKNRPDLERKA